MIHIKKKKHLFYQYCGYIVNGIKFNRAFNKKPRYFMQTPKKSDEKLTSHRGDTLFYICKVHGLAPSLCLETFLSDD